MKWTDGQSGRTDKVGDGQTKWTTDVRTKWADGQSGRWTTWTDGKSGRTYKVHGWPKWTNGQSELTDKVDGRSRVEKKQEGRSEQSEATAYSGCWIGIVFFAEVTMLCHLCP